MSPVAIWACVLFCHLCCCLLRVVIDGSIGLLCSFLHRFLFLCGSLLNLYLWSIAAAVFYFYFDMDAFLIGFAVAKRRKKTGKSCARYEKVTSFSMFHSGKYTVVGGGEQENGADKGFFASGTRIFVADLGRGSTLF